MAVFSRGSKSARFINSNSICLFQVNRKLPRFLSGYGTGVSSPECTRYNIHQSLSQRLLAPAINRSETQQFAGIAGRKNEWFNSMLGKDCCSTSSPLTRWTVLSIEEGLKTKSKIILKAWMGFVNETLIEFSGLLVLRG